MKEKKEHWWTKLKRKWDEDLNPAEKACIISAVTGAASGIVTGIYIGATASSYKWQREYDALTEVASDEAVKAYDQGVFDGATNPMLLRNLKDLGRI